MSYSVQRTPKDIPILTTGVCILCAVIFLQMQSANTYSESLRWGLYPETAIYGGAFWALITSAFVHIEPLHLLFNLYWLWILGGAFERAFGALRWIAFVLVAAFVSSGLQLFSGSSGIGLSGVGYALFGFGWIARSRYAEFAQIIDKRTAQTFLGWGILCFIMTEAHQWNIANYAHLGGLLIGVTIGGMAALPKTRIPLAFATLALIGGSCVPLFWNPLSPEWVNWKAEKAFETKSYGQAIPYLERSADLDNSPENLEYAYYNLAEIYSVQGNAERYNHFLDLLGKVNPEKAKEVVGHHGTPEEVAARQKE